MSAKIKCLYITPGTEPEIVEIKPELKELQRLVGGCIEALPAFADVPNNYTAYCNEEGKFEGLQPNFPLATTAGRIYDIVAGPVVIVGYDDESEEDVDLTDEECAQWKEIIASLRRKVPTLCVGPTFRAGREI